MGLRSRLKSLARDLIGRPPVAAPATDPVRAHAADPVRPPAVAPAPAAAPLVPAPPPAAAPVNAPVAPPPNAPPLAAAPAEPTDGPSPEEKAARHLARTRQGLLRHVIAAGDTISLGALHEHSERRYFIGHKKFSDLMEAMIAADELAYDAEKGEATITATGRLAANG